MLCLHSILPLKKISISKSATKTSLSLMLTDDRAFIASENLDKIYSY
jgi:hypothetical protein